MNIITIDTGTTNTRVSAWRNNEIIAQSSRPVGVRDTAMTGSTDTLMYGVADAVRQVREDAGMTATGCVTILSAGMITSNMGLYEIPHLLAPVGKEELAAGMTAAQLPEIAKEPIWFVPGVRNHNNAVTLDNAEMMDIMRGEETETIGVLHTLSVKGPALIVLPGSHSKFVKVDAHGRIEGCVTTIGGELLDAISHHTLLSSSVKAFASDIDMDTLVCGANQCRNVGLSRTCFSVRVLDLFAGLTDNQKANVLLGAVLQDDLQAVKNSSAFTLTSETSVIVCGKEILKQAFTLLLQHDPWFTGEITVAPESCSLSGAGLLALAHHRELI